MTAPEKKFVTAERAQMSQRGTLDRRGKWARVPSPEGEIRLSLQEQLMRHSVGDA